MKNRIHIINIVFIVLGALVIGRGAWLFLLPNQKLGAVKKRLFEKVVQIKPQRGVIYDRYGRALALSVSSFSLFADPSLIKDNRRAAQKLSALLKIPRSRIIKKLKNKKRRFVWIKRHITNKEKEAVRSFNIYGLGFIEEPKRVYPGRSLMSQVLGFTGVDGHGLEGLELYYDGLLRGAEQRMVAPKDARGRPLVTPTPIFLDQSKGLDIYLTIDSDLQFVLETKLKEAMKKRKAKAAMGIVIDAKNSEILALANEPGFDPNRPLAFSSHLYRNRVVSDNFEPGSTFKTFIVGAALKEGKAPHLKYDTKKGRLKVGGHTIHEAESDRQYKSLSILEILAVSSNVGSALLALDLKAPAVYSHLTQFGFGEKLGLDFPLEGKGLIQPLPWRKILTSNVGFGQGVSATPMQMAAAYTAIANGGFLKKPSILLSSVDVSNREKKELPPPPLRRIFTKAQSDTLTLMLTRAASTKGTGSQAQVKGFLTAGKTGTAQKPDPQNRGYLKDKYLSSFIGFVPAGKPRFVIYTALDEPEIDFYGSLSAAPVFREVGSYALRRAGLVPSFIEEQNVLSENKNEPILERAKARNKEKIPNLEGLSLRQAFRKAREFDIKLRVRGSGRVKSSSPQAGARIPSHRQVLIILSDP